MPKDYNSKEDRRLASHEVSKEWDQYHEERANLPTKISPIYHSSELKTTESAQEPTSIEDFESKLEKSIGFIPFNFQKDICLIKATDTCRCAECENGEVLFFENCNSCDGNGLEPGTSVHNCRRCNGTGFYNKFKGQHCFYCNGKGRHFTPCKHCKGNKQFLAHKIDCEFCEYRGRVTIGRWLAKNGSAEYIAKMANVMLACAEDTEYQERGFQIHQVLNNAIIFSRERQLDPDGKVFNEQIVQLVEQNWKTICDNVAQ